MTSQTWHTDHELLSAYVAGDLDAVNGASVEQHLTRCGDCRSAIRPLVDQRALERGWIGVRESIERPPQPLPVRIATRLGLGDSTAVLLAATASLRTAWLTSSVLALAFAAITVIATGGEALAPFLLVAPMVPVVGVAAAYGPSQDPLETLVVTAPYGRTRLVLLRTVAVLVSVLPVAVALGSLLPGPQWLAVAWLGPALAMVPLLLAAASFVGPRAAAAALAILWSGTVVGSTRRLPADWLLQSEQQVVYLGLAVVALAVLGVQYVRDQRIGAVL